jgi:GNAT superfamily N-acetyltransferase
MRALAAFEDYLDDFRVDEQSLRARAFGPTAQCQVFVAQWLGQVVGYAVLLEIPFTYDLRPTLLLKELYVADDYRGKGLGQKLLQHVAMSARTRGVGRLKWDVLTGNHPAMEFYERLGGFQDKKWLAYQLDSHGIERLAANLQAAGCDTSTT